MARIFNLCLSHSKTSFSILVSKFFQLSFRQMVLDSNLGEYNPGESSGCVGLHIEIVSLEARHGARFRKRKKGEWRQKTIEPLEKCGQPFTPTFTQPKADLTHLVTLVL